MNEYTGNETIEKMQQALGAAMEETNRLASLVRQGELRRLALEELLEDVASCGVEFEDERLRYVTVQIDRSTWLQLQRWLDSRGDGR